MRLLILGGTGRTGRQLAEQALAVGHHVTVVGRSARSDTVPPGSTPCPIDVSDPDALRRAVQGHDGVAVALSIPRRTRSPFSAVTGPPDLHSASTRVLLDAMEAHGLRRVVKVSAQGVGDSAPRAGWAFRALVQASNLRPAFADHARADRLVQASALDWTIVRPPILADGPPSPRGVVAGHDLTTGSFTRVRTADVARWILSALDDPATYGATVTLVPAS